MDLQMPNSESKDSKLGQGETKSFQPHKFGEFANVICYNCRTPGHHKASCLKPKICFICKESHVVVRKQGHKCAKYIDSAASGLGFYNVEILESERRKSWISLIVAKCTLKLEISPKKNYNWS